MISIIVPVYNAEKYLDRCIQSILAQTYTDFELLLINDGSTDSSGATCDKYAEQDSRVRVFHKENGGVSSARNMGLDNAVGEWITFIDSDDWVSPYYLSNLISHIGDNIDLVFSYAKHYYQDGRIVAENYPQRIVTEDISPLFIKNALSWHTSPWSKLYKSSLCSQIRFPKNVHLGEDLIFLYQYILISQSIFVSSDTDYFYNVDNIGGLTKRVNSVDSELASYREVVSILDNLIRCKQINDTVALREIGWLRASYARRVLNSLYYKNDLSFRGRKLVLESIDVNQYVSFISTSSIKEKLYVFLLKRKCFVLYDIIRKIVVCLKSQ